MAEDNGLDEGELAMKGNLLYEVITVAMLAEVRRVLVLRKR